MARGHARGTPPRVWSESAAQAALGSAIMDTAVDSDQLFRVPVQTAASDAHNPALETAALIAAPQWRVTIDIPQGPAVRDTSCRRARRVPRELLT